MAALGPAMVSTMVTGLLGSPILPMFLASMGVFTIPALSAQADARDFGFFKLNNTDEVFWPEHVSDLDVLAVADGEVIRTINTIRDNDKHFRQLTNPGGNDVIISHNDGSFYSYYAHCKYNSIKVHEGQRVKKGQVIAKMGDTGNSIAPHLHFEMTFTNPEYNVGIFKTLSNFEPYKCIPIPWERVLNAKTEKEKINIFKEYAAKKPIIDRSGTLDSCAFIC